MNAGAGVATEPTAPTADRLASALADALGTGLEARPLIEAAPATMLPAEGTADGVVVTLSGGDAHRALVVASPSLASAGDGGSPTGFLAAAASSLEAWAHGHGAAVTGSVPVVTPDAVAQVFELGGEDVLDAVALDLDGRHVATVAVLARVPQPVTPESAVPHEPTAEASASGATDEAGTSPGPSEERRTGSTGTTAGATAASIPAADAAPAAFRSPLSLIADVEMTVTAELGRTRMMVSELLNLGPGSVVELDRAAGSPADLLVNGTPVARGEVVVVDEEYAIRVTEILGTNEV